MSDLKEIERNHNLENLDPNYAKQVEALFKQPEIADLEGMQALKDRFLTGEIDQETFEKEFDALLKPELERKNREDAFRAKMGLGRVDYAKALTLEPRFHPEMDLTEQYVTFKWNGLELVEVNLIERPRWPDGTPMMVMQDLTPWERENFTKYYDIAQYHDDGTLNCELTAAFLDAFMIRQGERRMKKAKRMAFVRPRVPVGRNDPCWCGSLKKYKKCCLEKENAIIRGMSMEEAIRIYGKKAFDIMPIDDLAPDDGVEIEEVDGESESELVLAE